MIAMSFSYFIRCTRRHYSELESMHDIIQVYHIHKAYTVDTYDII